ncbi:class I histocompatibility antigen, Gogo-B*0103 alpha chain-like [Phyllobates terribilis]|uniref:class I histocompatibility antigen, Gogo-B*0103 alpha chain-like n=1 Tax=Phyllobates terribilis TaxID=111132 RepID=UPI003CCB6EA1
MSSRTTITLVKSRESLLSTLCMVGKPRFTSRYVRLKVPSYKLGTRLIGTFEVLKQINEISYKLKLPPSLRIPNSFHGSQYHTAPTTSDDVFEVENILAMKKCELCQSQVISETKKTPGSCTNVGRSRKVQVFLLMVSIHFAYAGDHSHYFFETVTTDLTSNMTSYTMRKTMDDVTLMWYDSNNEVVERRVPWFKGPNTTLWDASVKFHSMQKTMQKFLHFILNYMNHTEGYHIIQGLYGCTLYENRTVQASLSHHLDGKPFMSLNMESARFIAETPDAEKVAQIFNFNDSVLQEIRKMLVNTCIPHITELLSLGNCTFSRKEVPVVQMTQIPVDDGTLRVHCRAYGHYPKDISIMWYKNGQQISEEMTKRTTLPLLDLTYLTSLAFNVTSMADDVYTCRVNHSSMLRDFTQDWRISGDFGNLSSAPSGPSVGAVIGIGLAVVLVIVIVVFGSVSFTISRRQ